MVVPYINYKELNEFYTIPELCRLLAIDKNTLKEKSEQYGIEVRRNEIGDCGFVKYDVRKLHIALYYEDRGGRKASENPWA